jgi:hypothetical protein
MRYTQRKQDVLSWYRVCVGYDGVHYRTSGEVGDAMGRKNGQFAVQNYLKPMVQSAAR